MSRSYRKNLILTDQSNRHTKWVKRQASKKVRRYKRVIPFGNKYKTLFESYNICDYKVYYIKAKIGKRIYRFSEIEPLHRWKNK